MSNLKFVTLETLFPYGSLKPSSLIDSEAYLILEFPLMQALFTSKVGGIKIAFLESPLYSR